ncbi:Dihydropteridine reductase [Echinococcus granulosus]|nr:Dihydropteridine reductase [Echinococcus granulosus]
MSSKIVVYGGNGALGSSCVSFFKNNSFWVCSVGSVENIQADVNVIITKRDSLEEQYHEVSCCLKEVLNGCLVDGVFCVAGGWVGGNCSARGFIKSVDTAIKQSVWSSTVAASICSAYLRPGGMFILCGSMSALDGTPRMIGYGLAKAAVHHLASSLAEPESGMPPDSCVITLLFGILDTPANRKWMSKEDSSTWTPLDFINRLLLDWIQGKMRPKSGSLLKVITIDGKSECIPSNTF